jgi:hypothetical protein
MAKSKTVLLFFSDFEKDRFFKNDRYLKRIVRPLYGALFKKPTVTGYFVWLQLLVQALEQSGVEVKVNDYAAAKRDPGKPVGLVGYPHLLDTWDLPNPALLGPSLYSHPLQAPRLMEDARFRLYILTCDWMEKLFVPYYGAERCVMWNAGIDTERWADTRGLEKDIDVLIYDKVRWNRETLEESLVQPILERLARENLRSHRIRYGNYNYAMFRDLLKRSRAMLFLCEHETQGMAYQEAMACNVPILAWENGYWLDPDAGNYAEPVVATSVPYFSDECGARFAGAQDFEAAFTRFWEGLAGYQPRRYVQETLSFERSAGTYLRHYEALAD